MPTRKRDIFTVIEYVPNWFEAGAHNLIPTLEHEASALGSGPSRAPLAPETSTEWSVDQPGAICAL